jgi:hypothetical protein
MKVWRVQLARGTKQRMYDRGSKTYSQFKYAEWAYNNFVKQGFKVQLLEAEMPEPEWSVVKESQ